MIPNSLSGGIRPVKTIQLELKRFITPATTRLSIATTEPFEIKALRPPIFSCKGRNVPFRTPSEAESTAGKDFTRKNSRLYSPNFRPIPHRSYLYTLQATDCVWTVDKFAQIARHRLCLIETRGKDFFSPSFPQGAVMDDDSAAIGPAGSCPAIHKGSSGRPWLLADPTRRFPIRLHRSRGMPRMPRGKIRRPGKDRHAAYRFPGEHC